MFIEMVTNNTTSIGSHQKEKTRSYKHEIHKGLKQEEKISEANAQMLQAVLKEPRSNTRLLLSK